MPRRRPGECDFTNLSFVLTGRRSGLLSHVLAWVHRAVRGPSKPTHKASEVEEGADLEQTLARRMGVPPNERRVRRCLDEAVLPLQMCYQYRIFACNSCVIQVHRGNDEDNSRMPGLSLPQASAGDGFSPPRPPSHSQNAGTPSTLSTSPGESRDWNSARPPAPGAGADTFGAKRARTGGEFQPPPPPPPPRFSLPQGDRERQVSRGSGTTGGSGGASKTAQNHARRGSRDAEGGGSPGNIQASGRAG